MKVGWLEVGMGSGGQARLTRRQRDHRMCAFLDQARLAQLAAATNRTACTLECGLLAQGWGKSASLAFRAADTQMSAKW
jgi:hypothetical protein